MVVDVVGERVLLPVLSIVKLRCTKSSACRSNFILQPTRFGGGAWDFLSAEISSSAIRVKGGKRVRRFLLLTL